MGSIPTYSRQREPERQRCSGFCVFQPLSQTFGLPAPRPGGPFGIVQAPPKSCPRLRGKCRGASRDERGTARRCQAVLAFPLSLTSFDSSPAGGGAFWCSINTAYSAVPLRGAIVSMGLRGSPGGLRGEIEIFPGPLAKKVIKLLAVLFACFTPSGCSFHSHPPPSTGRLFSIAKLRMCFPNIPRIIAYMLKLTSISCFSIVMPIYIDNLMIMGYLITMRRKTPHR